MPERDTERRRDGGRTPAAPLPLRREPHPVLALQRLIGNRATAQVLARAPATTGSVHISGVGDIKVKGGNLQDWTGSTAPETVDVTSHKGRHSAKLEKLSGEQTRTDVKVTIAPAFNAGEHLNAGGGTTLEIKGARIHDYAAADGAETWRLAEFTALHRTKVTHRIS
jgi:hypothetical protein